MTEYRKGKGKLGLRIVYKKRPQDGFTVFVKTEAQLKEAIQEVKNNVGVISYKTVDLR
jgi:hypothetical protein